MKYRRALQCRQILVFASSAWIISCRADSTVATSQIAIVTIGLTRDTLQPGDTARLSAIARDSAGNPVSAAITWSTSSAAVATVSASGLVTAIAPGSVTIRASAAGRKASAQLIVTPPAIAIISSSANIAFAFTPGDTSPGAQSVNITSGGNGVIAGLVATVTYQQGQSGWLLASLVNAATPATLRFTAIVPGLGVGTHVALVTVASTDPGVASIPATVRVQITLSPVDGLAGATAVTPGKYQSCATTSPGTDYCWGSTGANLGAVGDGTTIQRLKPVPVAVGLTRLTIGDEHTCGLSAEGQAYCWGNGVEGDLGDGSVTLLRTTHGVVPGVLRFDQIEAGSHFTCGLAHDGTAYCWGLNNWGQVGAGISANNTYLPVAVAGGLNFAQLSAAADHVCGITTTMVAYCWGSNTWGELGDGTTTARFVPTPVAGGLAFVELAAGNTHTCARTAVGSIYCWGDNGSGQFGNGFLTSSLTPVVVPGQSAAAISAGLSFTCSLTTAGAARCWGRNAAGELGIGTQQTSVPTPQPVVGGHTFLQIKARDSKACGVAGDGLLYCWGLNLSGELGDGTTTYRTIPTVVHKP